MKDVIEPLAVVNIYIPNMKSLPDICADITDNDMTGGITGDGNTYRSISPQGAGTLA